MRRITLGKLSKIFQKYSGFYVLGAGVSAEVIPPGRSVATRVADLFIGGGAFSTTIPDSDERGRRILSQAKLSPRESLEINKENQNELIERMSSYCVQFSLYNQLSAPRFLGVKPASYLALNYFPHSTIIDYNLDGLSTDICGKKHNVIAPHGIIPKHFGSPSVRDFLRMTQHMHFDAVDFGHILIEKEPITVLNRLSIDLKNSQFVAIIGYTFGRDGNSLDDIHSFRVICEALRRDPMPVFVLEPYPDILVDHLRSELKTDKIFGVSLFWNCLAISILAMKNESLDLKNTDRIYESIIDLYGIGKNFSDLNYDDVIKITRILRKTYS